MPRPLPDYVKSPVREKILSKYPRTRLKGLAKETGIAYTTIAHLFQSKNHQLRAFMDLAERRGLDADQLAAILEVGPDERKSRLADLVGSDSEVIKEMAGGEVDFYLYDVLNGRSANAIRDIYIPIASALNLKLADLWGSVHGKS